LQEQVRTLVCYLWDNFLQLYAADEIFLMGVGNAYVGVKLLLINRGEIYSASIGKIIY
jgi:histone deacetylase 6